jgi:hypothetical protein
VNLEAQIVDRSSGTVREIELDCEVFDGEQRGRRYHGVTVTI